MVFNVSDYVSTEYLFLGALIAVIIAVVVLTIMERRLNRKAVIKKQEKETYFQRRIIETKDSESEPQRFLLNLDNTARDFFSEKFGAERDLKYSSLIPFFNKQGNKNAAIFSEKMQEALYAGDSLDKSKLDSLFRMLNNMIASSGGKAPDAESLQNTKPEVSPPLLPKPESKKEVENERMKREEILNRWAAMKEKMKPLPAMKKPIMPRELPKEEIVVSKKIVQYLLMGRNRGFGFSVLKQKLMENKFANEEIDDAIDYIKMLDSKKRKIDSSSIALDAAEKMKSILVYRGEQRNHPISKVGYPKSEKKSYRQIGSLDNLDRVREKIAKRRGSILREV